MGKYVEKATKLVAVINSQLDGCVVSMDDCYRGVFPWQSAYDISFQDNFNLVDAWMLTNRSREEIFEDLLMRRKAFLMQPEIQRLSRLLDDCDHWFCETSTDSNSRDIIRNLCEYYGETDSGSTDDDDVDQGTETEDELDEREPESDSGSTEDNDVDQGTESEDEFDG
ncbi:hypothetical protein OUZ56_012432 [Daphnia magna]|uniref:Uncharacterized protein n=1 Tax=Daphnia magna TaxID=35525 RepID=A0ABQ9Z2Z5_9CRUS|nr:hypothetical protein OUZ56_012432 [Daphnia magna]